MRACWSCHASDVDRNRRRKRKIEPELAAAEQFEIDGREQTAIDRRTVLDAHREVDRKPAAQRIEAGRRTGKPAARYRQCIDETDTDRLMIDTSQLSIQEGKVKLSVVDYQGIRPNEGEELLENGCKGRLTGEKFGGQPMDG